MHAIGPALSALARTLTSMADTILLEPGVEIRCAVPDCHSWHVAFTKETRPFEALSGPGLFLWTRCGNGLVFVGTWGAESRHPIRRTGESQNITEEVTMPDAPRFEAVAAQIVAMVTDPASAVVSDAAKTAAVAMELRLIWNARGAADIAKLEDEIQRVWTMTEPAGHLTRALRALDR